MDITRTEKWRIAPGKDQRENILDTIDVYRRYVRALSTVCITHWATVGSMSSKDAMTHLERMIHPTKNRPSVRYNYFHKTFPKFPSYYRRSAIHDAIGQVRSFLNRYDQWQTGEARKNKHASPPKFGVSNTYPSLYKGQCIKYNANFTAAEVKVRKNNDWVWITVPIKGTGKRTNCVKQKKVSPQLCCTKRKAYLAVPFEQKVTLHKQKADIVCAVDLGINTQVVASIVRGDGTVLAREFFNNANDIDQIHRRMQRIRSAAKKTKKLTKGFGKGWYRKAYGIAKNNAHQVTRNLVEFAEKHKATTIVFERLKGWRPKAPRYGLRKKFHTWFHRRIVTFTEWKWREKKGRMAFVSPANTSKFAYDGSGKVTRGIDGNQSLCRFRNGKIYNNDLSASYNIAAKFFLRGREPEQTEDGKSPTSVPRAPVTLSLLWTTVQA